MFPVFRKRITISAIIAIVLIHSSAVFMIYNLISIGAGTLLFGVLLHNAFPIDYKAKVDSDRFDADVFSLPIHYYFGFLSILLGFFWLLHQTDLFTFIETIPQSSFQDWRLLSCLLFSCIHSSIKILISTKSLEDSEIYELYAKSSKKNG